MPAAAEDPRTRTALDAYRAGALRWLGAGVIAVVLGVLLGVAVTAIAGSSGQRIPLAGPAVLVLVLLGAVAVVAGSGALLRSLRWRRALAVTQWRTGRLRIAGPAVIAFEPAGYDELDPGQAPVLLKLLSTTIWRTKLVQGLDGADVLAVPVGGGQWALTADGLGTAVGAREVRSRN